MAIGKFAEFNEYKAHHGELTEAQHQNTIAAHYTQDEYGEAFSLAVQTAGLPDAQQMDALARIHATFPDKHPLWKITESYLMLGRW